MIRVLSLCALVTASTAAAADGCAEFQTLATLLSSSAQPIDLPGPMDGADECRAEQAASGNKGVVCVWDAPYRDGTARARFDALDARLSACRIPGSRAVVDPAVNHPDTYMLKTYRVPGGLTLGLSLKDKASIQRTIVFLRAAPSE